MDRFRSFYTVAKESDRKLVISTKAAYLLKRLVEDKRLDLPDPLKDEDILVYFKRKKSCEFNESDYYKWERAFMEKITTCKFIHKHQNEVIMDLNFYQFAQLIDINPEGGSHFIHSMSEPFSEEDVEDEVMHNWLDHFEMKFHQLHASGHMKRDELLSMVETINPKKIFPIHTENQTLFKKTAKNVKRVQKGKEYSL